MISAVDLYELERKVGKDAAAVLTKSLRMKISETSKRKTGLAEKSSVTAVYKNQRLDRLTIKAPHYVFKQHYGFEGGKKKSANWRLKSTNVLNEALEHAEVLQNLADDISNIRSEEVISKINF